MRGGFDGLRDGLERRLREGVVGGAVEAEEGGDGVDPVELGAHGRRRGREAVSVVRAESRSGGPGQAGILQRAPSGLVEAPEPGRREREPPGTW